MKTANTIIPKPIGKILTNRPPSSDSLGVIQLKKLRYEVCLGHPGKPPTVCSLKSGKWFQLSWRDVVELAVAAGVDE